MLLKVVGASADILVIMTMRRVTNCVDLAHVLADLTGVGVSGVQAREAMHARGWTRYESLSPEDLGLLADDVLSSWSFDENA